MGGLGLPFVRRLRLSPIKGERISLLFCPIIDHKYQNIISVETTCHQLDAFQYSNKVPNLLNGPLSKVRSILDIKCAAYED